MGTKRVSTCDFCGKKETVHSAQDDAPWGWLVLLTVGANAGSYTPFREKAEGTFCSEECLSRYLDKRNKERASWNLTGDVEGASSSR